MKFSIRGLFSFHFSFTVPQFWKPRPAAAAVDYELDRFFIAGFQYHDGPEVIDSLEPGMELVLIHEADNPHDALAVAFRFGGAHLGYIPRQRNRTIAALLDQGAPMRALVTQVNPDAEPWHAIEVALSVFTGHALQAAGKGKKITFPEL